MECPPGDDEHHSSEHPSPEYLNQQTRNAKRSAPPAARTGKAKRTRTGCFTCRTRKIKCDEAVGRCGNCKRMGLECRWPAIRDALKSPSLGSPSDENIQNAVRGRPRRLIACRICRAARQKCSRDRPSCSRCCAHHLQCAYDENVVSRIDLTPAPTDLSTNAPAVLSTSPMDGPQNEQPMEQPWSRSAKPKVSSIDLLPRHVLDKHLDAFFTYIYPCQANAFIHRGTLLLNIQSGRVDKRLLLALCAVASRFVPSHDDSQPVLEGSAQAQNWAREAKTMLILEEDVTTDVVAAALLLAKHDINSGKYTAAWMLSSFATRAAFALDLHKGGRGDGKMTFVEQETGRRLLWACYCLDRMMSTGIPEFVIIRPEHIRIQLPCEEQQYLLGIPCVTPVPNLEAETSGRDMNVPEQAAAEREVGTFGHYVQIMGMRFMILKYTRNRNDDPNQLPPWDPSSTFTKCVHKLSAWHSSLLPQFQLQPETIYARQAQNQLTLLIMLHLWYDQCMSDLYRIAMPGFPETLPASMLKTAPVGWVEQQQLLCVCHARNVSSTLKTVAAYVSSNSFVFLDASLPMIVFESLRVQVQWHFLLPLEAQAETLPDLEKESVKMMGYVERMTKYFRQAQWNLNEMRKMLRRHGIVTGGPGSIGPERGETSGAQTPHHPWLRRVANIKQVSGTASADATRGAMHGQLSVNENLAVPLTELHHPIANNSIPEVPIEDLENDTIQTFPPPQHAAETVSTGLSYRNDSDVLQQDFDILLDGYNREQIIPDISSFFGIFSDWTAREVEERSALDSVMVLDG